MVVAFGMLGIFFPMTIFLQEVLGFTPVNAGLTMVPMSLMILVVAPLAGRLDRPHRARWLVFAGTAMMARHPVHHLQTSADTTVASLPPAMS